MTGTGGLEARPTARGSSRADPTPPLDPHTHLDAKAAKGRLEFGDALRGLAAFTVAFQHAAELQYRDYLEFTTTTFRPGEMGVVLFFLLSGFIVPVSLERYGSGVRFWVSRFFRLFPLYWAAIALALVLGLGFDRYPVPGTPGDRAGMILANLTMMQDFLHQPLILGNSWTLAYEMVFYLIITALFIAGLHKRSLAIAVAWLTAALLLGVFRAPELTSMLVDPTKRQLLLVAGLTAGAAAVVAWFGRLGPKRTAQVAIISALVVPGFMNRPQPLWFAVLLMATMFVGTVMFRAVNGELPWRAAWAVYGIAVVVLVASNLQSVIPYADASTGAQISWEGETSTFLVAYALFGVGLLLRERSFWRPLMYLGLISYSLYLLHPIVYYAIPPVPADVAHHAILTVVIWLTFATLLAALTYHLVEAPFMKLGRRASKLVGRWQAERAPRAQHDPVKEPDGR